MLRDVEIMDAVFGRKGPSLISPFSPLRVQPVSVDLLLGPMLSFPTSDGVVDVMYDEPDTWEVDMQAVGYDARGPGYCMHPGQFVLGHTVERFHMPDDLVGRIDGKSSLGRLGLMIHITAGLVDPGFQGQLVLELRNVGPLPLVLRPDMRIAQISFEQLTGPCAYPYGSERLNSKYQGQEGVVGSRYHLNYHEA